MDSFILQVHETSEATDCAPSGAACRLVLSCDAWLRGLPPPPPLVGMQHPDIRYTYAKTPNKARVYLPSLSSYDVRWKVFYQIPLPMARGCTDFFRSPLSYKIGADARPRNYTKASRFRFTNIADLRLWSGRKHWESGYELVVFRGRASTQMEEQTLGNSRSSEGEL